MFSRFFITRPVFSTVIALMLLVVGIVAMYYSPVEQYPDIAPPCITVTAVFPGANSEAIADAVAAPIEDQMAGVANMIYMQSSSANGNSTYTLNIYFDIGTDVKAVEADVLNRINTAMSQLPPAVQQQGVTVRAASPSLFLLIPFYAPSGNPSLLTISNYVQRYIEPVLSQVPGVGLVALHGQRTYSMRVVLDINKMKYYKISTQDILNAVQDQNAQYAIGMTAMEPMQGNENFSFMINSPGYYTNVAQLQNTVLRADKNTVDVVKLSDVATVKLDAENYDGYFHEVLRDDKTNLTHIYPGMVAMVYLAPGANQIAVKEKINKTLHELSSYMPKGMTYLFHYDSSEYVELSIQAVVITLITAFFLVFGIVLLFMQNLRATIIPMLVVPVSIVGTFAFMKIFGFTINTLTLFGLVLAIGIVVDDAIVVLECVERIMREENCSSFDASIKAMQEVTSPIIAIVLVLNAVFIPATFLGGFTGVLIKQFAATIAISVTISGVLALTFTPCLCAVFLKNSKATQSFRLGRRFFECFNQAFFWVKEHYLRGVSWNIQHVKTAMFLWGGACIAAIILFLSVPTALIPLEDMGYFFNEIHTAPASSMNFTLNQAKTIAQKIMQFPFIQRVALLGGHDIADNNTTKTNTTSFDIILKPYGQRKENINQVISIMNQLDDNNKNIVGNAFNQPPVQGMSTMGGVTFYLRAQQPVDVQTIADDSAKLVQYMQAHYPAVLSAQQFYNVNTPQLYVDIDARKAYLYGTTYADIFSALQSTYGNYFVNYFNHWNDLYWIMLVGDYHYRNTAEKMQSIYVKSKTGDMVPLGSLLRLHYKTGAEVVTRFNDYLASQIVVNPNAAKGYTDGDVMKAVQDAVANVTHGKYSIQWFGPSYQETLAGNESLIACVFGVIMIFLILAALYGLWLLPAVVILALPFALFGAIFTLFVFHKANDVYFQISLLALMGLSAKNVILILQFALQKFREGGAVSLQDAALYAAKIRFRPIVMTSLAFIFSSVALVMATGAGANAQHSVGAGIIGGMLGSTCLAVLFVPLFFVLAMRHSR